MYPRTVTTSNVKRFQTAIDAMNARGAHEASWVLVTGDAGHGKTHTAMHWGMQHDAPVIRISAAVTPHWVLTDLVRELGERAPARSCEDLMTQAIRHLERRPRPIVLDEGEAAVRSDMRCLEVIRQISDTLEIPVVITGREWFSARIKGQRQLWSRISGFAELEPLTLADMKLLREGLLECDSLDELDPLLLAETRGFVREAKNALRLIEKVGSKSGRPVGLADIEGLRLCGEHTKAVSPVARRRERKVGAA